MEIGTQQEADPLKGLGMQGIQGWKRERSMSPSTDLSGRPSPIKVIARIVKRFAVDQEDLPVKVRITALYVCSM